MTEYEFIMIGPSGTTPSGKTKIFTVYNKRSGDRLGVIRFSGGWRQYTFRPVERTEYSAGCLSDIASFIEGETKMWRGGL